MCITRLWSWFCALLRFAYTRTTLFYRVLSSRLLLRFPFCRINMGSDSECELDSTWEDESEYNDRTEQEEQKMKFNRSRRNMRAAKDTQDFRHSVKNLDDDDDEDGEESDNGPFYNLEFYKGQRKSSPDEIHIDEFHQRWYGNYEWLEDVHTYIQWLFPLQERGVNWSAHVLTKKEIKRFRRDEQARNNLVKSYEMMLDFYGIRLVDEHTGEVKRAPHWEERFKNLNRFTHNNLRITRILKCLGTLGLQHYQFPLVKFFLQETLVEGELQRVKESVLDYFIFVVLDKSERQELVRYAYEHFRPREYFVWGPKKILQKEEAKEGEQERMKLPESTHEMSKQEASPPVEGIGSKKSSNKESSPKLMETKIESKQRGNAKSVEKPNQEMSGDGNVENFISANMPQSNDDDDGSNLDETENPSRKAQKVVEPNQEMSVDCVDVDMTPANVLQDKDEGRNPDENENTSENEMASSPNKLNIQDNKSDQGANDENNQCNSENRVEKVVEPNEEMSVDCVDVDMTPANVLQGKDEGRNPDENENTSENEMASSPNKLNIQDNKSDQGVNDENNQCNLENRVQKVVEPNQEMSVDIDMTPANVLQGKDEGRNPDENENTSENEMPGSPNNLNEQNNVVYQGTKDDKKINASQKMKVQ